MANLLDDIVVAKWNPLLVQLPITSLVDQFPNTLQVRVSGNETWMFRLQDIKLISGISVFRFFQKSGIWPCRPVLCEYGITNATLEKLVHLSRQYTGYSTVNKGTKVAKQIEFMFHSLDPEAT